MCKKPNDSYLFRPRLTRRLDSAPPGTLTVLTAPAGYGKTALLHEWTATTADTVVSLSPAGPTPAGWIDRLRSVGLTLPALPPESWPAAWIALCNAAAKASPFTLILDDFTAAPPPLIAALDEIIDYLPPTLRLILAGRAEPPLSLPRLRVRRRLTELKAADLAFTPEETTAWLGQPDPALHILTAGWITGLHLHKKRAGESLSPALIDYFSTEVFSPQPQAVRRFLLQTAALDPLDAAGCNAVTGRRDSQAQLERLEAAGLFLFAETPERQTFRYHPLFASFLRNNATPNPK